MTVEEDIKKLAKAIIELDTRADFKINSTLRTEIDNISNRR